MSILSDSYISFVNLDHRIDRLAHMTSELKRVGIEAERTRGILPKDIPPQPRFEKILGRTPGALGCYFAQMSIMNLALVCNRHAFVMEDDLIFCDDFHERMNHFEQFLEGKPWDIIWLGGTYHIEPTWHKAGHELLPACTCELNRDWEPTEDPKIVRTFGEWSTYGYIVNVESTVKVLNMLHDFLPYSIGIDYSMIQMQPKLITYAFNPGMVKQMDNRSDIGNGDTIFSGFSKLGAHWFSDKM